MLTADRSFYLELVFLDLRLQGGAGETQELGGTGSIAARQVEGLANKNAGGVVHHGVEKTFAVTFGQLLSEQLTEGFGH